MKILGILILLFSFASTALAVTEDQEEIVGYNAGTGDQNFDFATAPTAGCTVVVAGSFAGNLTDMVFGASGVFDNQGNTYTVTQSSPGGHNVAMIAVANNVISSGTFTITLNPQNSLFTFYALVVFKSFCGLANPSIDKTATAADPGPQASDATVSTAATVQANETIIAALALCSAGDTALNITTPTPATYTDLITAQDCTAGQTGNIAWKNVKAAGVQTATWTHDDVTGSGGYNGWAAAIVTLKDAVPGGAVAARRRSPVVVQ